MKERSCFYCKNFKLCFLRHAVDDLTHHCHILATDKGETPGTFMDIYTAVAGACKEYEENPDA